MPRKIFVSYKYSDSSVLPLNGDDSTLAKDYANKTQFLLIEKGHTYKGERDGDDLKHLAIETIEKKLKDRLYDTSVTIVLVSRNMKEDYRPENDQWIPWEIAYSLKEISRGGRTSMSNAILAVVLPDEVGDYSYFIRQTGCEKCNCRIVNTGRLFKIHADNMYNQRNKDIVKCSNPFCSANSVEMYIGDPSYISFIEWELFKKNINTYIDIAVRIKEKINDYDVAKQIQKTIW
ncbi:MAG: TIR domain-containing protein [Gammaproteobacteria bacterium]|nr:TIR domain-containing protein [Gammaproteobacteria bacterium]